VRRLIDAAWHAPRVLLIGLVRAYRLLLSPWLGQSCRFEPTCSRYAIAALERHGAVAGSAYAGWRLLRCNPWCEGGCDPVPDNAPWVRAKASPSAPPAAGLFTGLLPTDSGDGATAVRPAAVAAADPTLSKTPS
jgi:putative membrane protein insertion efficiency factor